MLRCREHEKLEPLDNFRSRRFHFFHFNERVLSGHELSKNVWPWKVTVSRSNEQWWICPKKSDIFIPRSLNSVTGSGHVKCKENPLGCKLHGNSACKIYLLLSLIFTTVFSSDHVLIMCKLSYIMNGQTSCHLIVHDISTETKHGKWSYERQKGTGHVFYMAIPSHTAESVYHLLAPWSCCHTMIEGLRCSQ